MTVIAYRYPFIAGDYKAVDSIGYASSWDTKIYTRTGEQGTLYMGYSGTGGWEDDVMEYIWLELTKQLKPEAIQKLKDREQEEKGGLDYNCIVVFKPATGPIQVYEWYSNGRYMLMRAPYVACGSGTKLAIGAMAFGASALQAVNVALLDPYVGYPIDGYNVETGEYFRHNTPEDFKNNT